MFAKIKAFFSKMQIN